MKGSPSTTSLAVDTLTEAGVYPARVGIATGLRQTCWYDHNLSNARNVKLVQGRLLAAHPGSSPTRA